MTDTHDLARPDAQAEARSEFDRWWSMSKYRQVIFADAPTRQAALDGWNAALAAKDAELAMVNDRLATAYRVKAEMNDLANEERRLRLAAEAQLAEANKALDQIIERSNTDELGTSKVNDMRQIARRAREGGQNV